MAPPNDGAVSYLVTSHSKAFPVAWNDCYGSLLNPGEEKYETAKAMDCGFFDLVKAQVKPGKANHPMNCINYAQAAGYCQAMGKRLPTEVE